MDDNQENNPPDPPNKKPRLSLSLKGKGRFASPLPLEEMSSVCEGYTPANTSKNTDWAVRVFNEWRKARPTEEEGECPPDLLECPCAEKLNFWLARFVVECRRVDGKLLSKYVELMCEDAGLEKRSNHSLRATGASALFTAGVPEKIIKGITGHRSSKALEVYERPTQSQLQAVSSVMSQPGCSFSEELHSRSEVYEHKKEMTTSGAGLLGSMFSGLNECSIQIAPQSMVVNTMQSPQSQSTGK